MEIRLGPNCTREGTGRSEDKAREDMGICKAIFGAKLGNVDQQNSKKLGLIEDNAMRRPLTVRPFKLTILAEIAMRFPRRRPNHQQIPMNDWVQVVLAIENDKQMVQSQRSTG